MFNILFLVSLIALWSTLVSSSSASTAIYEVYGKKSLYPPDGEVVVLTADALKEIVFGSKLAWLVEFYADWCYYSKTFVPQYEEIAEKTHDIRQVCIVASFNCAADESNENMCHQIGIRSFPTVRYFEAFSTNVTYSNGTYMNQGEKLKRGDTAKMRQELMDLLCREMNTKTSCIIHTSKSVL